MICGPFSGTLPIVSRWHRWPCLQPVCRSLGAAAILAGLIPAFCLALSAASLLVALHGLVELVPRPSRPVLRP
jgi:hypothetical protein